MPSVKPNASKVTELDEMQKKMVYMRNRTAMFNEMWKDTLFKGGLALIALSVYQTYKASNDDTTEVVAFFMISIFIACGATFFIKEMNVHKHIIPITFGMCAIQLVWWWRGIDTANKEQQPFPNSAMFFVICYGAHKFMRRNFDEHNDAVYKVASMNDTVNTGDSKKGMQHKKNKNKKID